MYFEYFSSIMLSIAIEIAIDSAVNMEQLVGKL
jgi:hypothetical protein